MNEDLEKEIDKVLIAMVDTLEEQGQTIDSWYFELDHGNEERIDLIRRTEIEEESLDRVIKICVSRKYLKATSMVGFKMKLTEEGQGRGISSKIPTEQHIKPNGNVSIGELNVTNSGQFQVGLNNQINIENLFSSLVKEIESAKGNSEEKAEAKKKLKEFIEQPLVLTLLGAAASSILSLL